MQIDKIQFKNYRSIKSAEVEFGPFNTIIGKNNVGKSNIIKAIVDFAGHWNENYGRPSWSSRLNQQKSAEELMVKLQLDLNREEKRSVIQRLQDRGVGEAYINFITDTGSFEKVRVQVTATESESGSFSWSTLIDGKWTDLVRRDGDRFDSITYSELPPKEINESGNGDRADNVVQPLVKDSAKEWQLATAFREPENEMVTERADHLKQSGENLVQVVDTMFRNYPDRFSSVENAFVEIMEGVTGLRTPFVSANRTTIMVDEKGYPSGFSLSEISAGSKDVLTLITKLVMAENSDILLVEEPELHIHPNAQQAIYDLLQDIASEGGPQVLVSTHSDAFVDRTDTDNIIAVKRNVDTSIQTINEEGIDDLLESLGYDKSELYQSDVVVFVEGRSDQEILNEFSEILAADSDEYHSLADLGVSVHALGGDRMREHGAELGNLLGHMRTPYLFVADSDDQEPEEKAEKLREAVDSGNVEVLNDYCIESYLLQMPNAISSAFNFDVDEVEAFITENEDRPNGKSVMKDLFDKFTDGKKSYDETEHGWMIARHAEPEEVPDELEELITKIQGMAQ
ncbi:ATP-dependent nuclease [Halorussus salinus]|uniref:ATP-dependent nuclease n=1 Tax=Halorussus salinus TaxID=1364935 RepID=UPI001092E594|nr:AAA family ATPase [Halorussus salinus]